MCHVAIVSSVLEPLVDGMKVIATGEINLYEPHGRYQMVNSGVSSLRG